MEWWFNFPNDSGFGVDFLVVPAVSGIGELNWDQFDQFYPRYRIWNTFFFEILKISIQDFWHHIQKKDHNFSHMETHGKAYFLLWRTLFLWNQSESNILEPSVDCSPNVKCHFLRVSITPRPVWHLSFYSILNPWSKLS